MLTTVVGPVLRKICKSNIHEIIRSAIRAASSLLSSQERLGTNRSNHRTESVRKPISAEKRKSLLRRQAIAVPAPMSIENTILLYHLSFLSPNPIEGITNTVRIRSPRKIESIGRLIDDFAAYSFRL